MPGTLIGTAGHIDHGKTRLVEALTGIDCDRWVEEKERGITIDLGFAHLEEGDLQIGFVDVPGHERFLHNALAGLGGIRIMLLVVAADEGVKPQTREHLDICTLLGIPAGLVALTKCDLVSSDLIELARLEVEELLAGTPFAAAPILPVSSLNGDGVQDLKARLIELARRWRPDADPARPARLPIDRAFLLKGLGVVVTGTLASGALRAGDTLEVLPSGRRARVRSVQVHGESRGTAEAGERTALQLTGLGLDELARGDQLAVPGAYRPTTALVAHLRLLADAPRPIKGQTPIAFHLFSSESPGRLRPLDGAIEPGSSGTVEIRLARPVVGVRGDRFVIRRPSPPLTLGGGEVLDPQPRRRRGRRLAPALEALAASQEATLLLWAADEAEHGLETPAVAQRLGRTVESVRPHLEALANEQKLLLAPSGQGHGERWLAPAAYRRVAGRAQRVLKEFFRRERMARGMPKAEAVRRILPGRAAELTDVYLAWLGAQEILAIEGDRVDLPGRRAELTGEESRLAAEIEARYERAGLEPPAPAAVADELGAKREIVEGVARYLVEREKLERLPGGLLISAAAIRRVASELRGSGPDRFTVPDFKSRFGLTRKWAIPILEHLDSSGVTRRVGDQRMVVGRRRDST